MAEDHAGRVAAVFTADADLQVLADTAAFLDAIFITYRRRLIDRLERIVRNNVVLFVVVDEPAVVVAALPNVVCVRSLVPKLKNSAPLAI